MAEHPKRQESIAKLAELISDIEYAMLTTVEVDGSLHSRPMANQKEKFDGTLWFFTRADSPKVDEIMHDRHVGVSFAEPKKQNYVSMSGTAKIVRDPRKAEQYWNPAYKAWFPGGLDDPQLAMIRVDVHKAEYWDSSASVMVHLLGFVKATVTGTEYKPGENEKVFL